MTRIPRSLLIAALVIVTAVAFYGSLDLVELLVSHPLLHAVNSGRDGCVRVLLEAGAPIGPQGGGEALHAACYRGYPGIVRMLHPWHQHLQHPGTSTSSTPGTSTSSTLAPAPPAPPAPAPPAPPAPAPPAPWHQHLQHPRHPRHPRHVFPCTVEPL